MRFQKNYLYDRLVSLSQSSIYPYHMPGHKRNMTGCPLEQLYQIDITEIDGFDNLHEPEGIISDMQERIKSIYHTEETFCLINGSSCGILSAISACTSRGDTIIVGRNAHKSVYHAIFQEELTAVYLYPEELEEYGLYGVLRPQDVESALERHPECRVVVITTPTYEGIVLDIGKISEIVHRHEGILIVDEAHGAHLIFTGQEEKSAVTQGADLVVQSVHKTLPAPTQTALLHVCSQRVDLEQIRKYLRIYQSSSPSYVLLTGIDQCFRFLKDKGQERKQVFCQNIKQLRKDLEQCRYIKTVPGTESGKLVLSVRNSRWTGKRLYDTLLERYGLQLEMAAGNYVIAILTLMDTQEGYDRLREAVLEIDKNINKEEVTNGWQNDCGEISYVRNLRLRTGMTLYEAATALREAVDLKKSCGRIAAEFVNLYPPGIPLIVPGEYYTEEVIEVLYGSRQEGLTVQGLDQKGQVYAVLA